MKARICRFVGVYAFWVVLFGLQKVLFLCFYRGMVKVPHTSDFADVLWHGLPLDLSVAGYLTVIPALLLVASVWSGGKWLRRVGRLWAAFAAVVTAAVCTLNLALYGYWGFPLDTTPFFYFRSSPADALASVPLWQGALGMVAMAVMAVATYKVLVAIVPGKPLLPVVGGRRRVAQGVLMGALTAALLLPIRGGVTVSTMNVGHAFYSDDVCLNHAAVNPALSLMESVVKEGDFASQYRFMEPAEARRTFASMMSRAGAGTATRTTPMLTTQRPNVVFVILESFSTHLMRRFGCRENVVPCLDSIAAGGLLFTNFYANSFRTDRGLVSILSGYPAQPTTSIMKYPHKTQHLPSIAASLRAHGYRTRYYYGGDADFTNMRSYLVSSRFGSIVSDRDFPVTARLSKWGVPDHLLFERVLADLRREKPGAAPAFTVVQTSSSHEPFEVPYSRLADKRLNAFAYTDSVLGHFVNELRRMPGWASTLVVLVPDHQGCWPQGLESTSPERFRIPLVLTGGSLAAGGSTCNRFGSQTDIAATLLAQLGIGHEAFTFSKDLFSPTTEGFSFFTIPDAFGLATDCGTVVYDNRAGRVAYRSGTADAGLLRRGQAFLQTLYDDLARR